MHRYQDGREARELRRRASALASTHPSGPDFGTLSPEIAKSMFHDLQVHRIELEMQNDELLQVQEDLDFSRARYFDLYDLAPVGYLTLDPEGWIREANLTAATLLGLARSELVGVPITRYIHSEDQDIYYVHRQRCIDTREPQACELRMVKRGGGSFRVVLTGTETLAPPRGRADPEASETRIVMSDCSERVALEEEKARLELLLQDARKLETLGVFAGGVAHDFNNLLTAILSNASLGNLALAEHGVVAPYFDAIERATQRAAMLTGQLLSYAGKGRRVMREVDLGLLVREIVQILSASLPANLSLEMEGEGPIPLVMGDPDQLSQVLMNLAVNAFEAFPAGGSGRITLVTGTVVGSEAGVEPGSWALPLPPAPCVTIEVSDTGAGIPPEILPMIFDPFFTTKFTGRGLGLAAAIGILRSHGGSLRVQSGSGRGSSFKVFLPVRPA